MRSLLLSTVLFAAFTVPSSAGVITVADFTADAASISVVSTPPDDLIAATLISAASWTAETVQIPLGGLAHGDLVTLTNPIHLATGSTVSISWDGGTFHDITTVTSIAKTTDAVTVAATGELVGPGVGENASNLQLAWTQAGGTGLAISGSGSYTAQTVVPEPSTWAMLILGLVSLAWLGFRRQSSTFLEV